MPSEHQLAYVKGLRDLADYLERHPEIPCRMHEQIDVFVHEKDEMAALARKLAPIEKRYCGNYLMLQKKFGPICLEINIFRDKVCRKIETRKTVTKPKYVLVEGETETVEEVETSWECTEPLLSTTESQP